MIFSKTVLQSCATFTAILYFHLMSYLFILFNLCILLIYYEYWLFLSTNCFLIVCIALRIKSTLQSFASKTFNDQTLLYLFILVSSQVPALHTALSSWHATLPLISRLLHMLFPLPGTLLHLFTWLIPTHPSGPSLNVASSGKLPWLHSQTMVGAPSLRTIAPYTYP